VVEVIGEVQHVPPKRSVLSPEDRVMTCCLKITTSKQKWNVYVDESFRK